MEILFTVNTESGTIRGRGTKPVRIRTSTVCFLGHGEGMRAGIAWCSEKDDYDHVYGLLLAFKRAVAQIPRPERAAWWYQFRDQTGISIDVQRAVTGECRRRISERF